MKKNGLRWGILGTGFIANLMAQAIRESTANRLIAIASRDLSRAKVFAEKYSIDNAYGDYAHLLSNKSIDIVYIALPNSLHLEWIIRAAESGKHILCEKPFTVDHSEAEIAFRSVEKAGVFCMEAFMYRCHPQTLKVAELLKQERIGRVHLIEAAFTVGQDVFANTIHMNAGLASGGIMDMGCYCVSASRFISGVADNKAFRQPRKMAALGRIGKEGIDAYASAILEFDDDCSATLITSTEYGMYSSLRVIGSKGSIIVPNPWLPGKESTIILKSFNGSTEKLNIKTNLSLYCHEVETVSRYISSGKIQAESPAMSWQDTLGNMEVLDQWRSAIGLKFNH